MITIAQDQRRWCCSPSAADLHLATLFPPPCLHHTPFDKQIDRRARPPDDTTIRRLHRERSRSVYLLGRRPQRDDASKVNPHRRPSSDRCVAAAASIPSLRPTLIPAVTAPPSTDEHHSPTTTPKAQCAIETRSVVASASSSAARRRRGCAWKPSGIKAIGSTARGKPHRTRNGTGKTLSEAEAGRDASAGTSSHAAAARRAERNGIISRVRVDAGAFAAA